MKKKFALVQWIGGKYDNTYTAGEPVEWILDFDANRFDPAKESEDQSYVIQWRENKGGKVPKSGWKYYDSKVVRVSRRIQSLENEIAILEGAVSPLRLYLPDDPIELPIGKRLDDLYDNVEEHEGVASTSTSNSRSSQKRMSTEQNEMEATLSDKNTPLVYQV